MLPEFLRSQESSQSTWHQREAHTIYYGSRTDYLQTIYPHPLGMVSLHTKYNEEDMRRRFGELFSIVTEIDLICPSSQTANQPARPRSIQPTPLGTHFRIVYHSPDETSLTSFTTCATYEVDDQLGIWRQAGTLQLGITAENLHILKSSLDLLKHVHANTHGPFGISVQHQIDRFQALVKLLKRDPDFNAILENNPNFQLPILPDMLKKRKGNDQPPLR